MMKMILLMLFMFPLCFSSFWIFQFSLFLLFFYTFTFMSYNYLILNMSYWFGMDLLSFTLILLSVWICSLMILASSKLFLLKNFFNLFMFIVMFLLFTLILIFSSLNLFMFYLFFEISLIPMFILILGWGYQSERIEAGVYLLFYTLVVSLPMMIGIFYIYNNINSLEFFMFNNFSSLNLYLYISMILSFLVKMPMYIVHVWLPKAHVEAPISGSMVLAGIMLKLGGYGMMRLLIMFQKFFLSVNIFIMSLSLTGGVIISFLCIRQYDMKSLIAYSSVAHMSMVLGGILTLSVWGMTGSLLLMLAHGLSSSGLFCLANVNYERFNSRSMYLNKGMINLSSTLAMWWFLFSACNMSAPPSLNLFGEIMLMSSLVSFSYWYIYLIMFLLFNSAVYSLYLYSFSNHGKINVSLLSFKNINFREYLLLFLHWLPLNIMFLKLDLFSLWI
uniref:NADH-ubiquinone oxidoreductase chain 4 n=1 Tax=Sphindus dubius TaxID=295944 RepID=A0A0S2MQM3_9CUCU|nr:NADH deshydrogenase subunit 4 [Sphindus dubius]